MGRIPPRKRSICPASPACRKSSCRFFFADSRLHVHSILNSVRKLNIPQANVKSLLRQWLDTPETTRFLLIESREALREIILAEIRQALAFPVSGCDSEDPMLREKLIGAIPLALPSKTEFVRTLLPAGTELITLQVRSAASALAGNLPVPSDALVAVASAWPQFLETARTMLIAAGLAPDALLIRDASEAGWQDGLSQTAGVVCDAFTATRLPKTVRAIAFPLLSEAAIEELQRRSRATV